MQVRCLGTEVEVHGRHDLWPHDRKTRSIDCSGFLFVFVAVFVIWNHQYLELQDQLAKEIIIFSWKTLFFIEICHASLIVLYSLVIKMWSEKNWHMVQNWYFWVISIMWKFALSSFHKFLLGSPLILVSKVIDVQVL